MGGALSSDGNYGTLSSPSLMYQKSPQHNLIRKRHLPKRRHSRIKKYLVKKDIYKINDTTDTECKPFTESRNTSIINWYKQVIDSQHLEYILDRSVNLDKETLDAARKAILECATILLNSKINQFKQKGENFCISRILLTILAETCLVLSMKVILQYDYLERIFPIYTYMNKIINKIENIDPKESLKIMKQMEADILKTVDWKPCNLVDFVAIS